MSVLATQMDLFNPNQTETEPMTTSFEEILNRKVDDVKPPPLLPQGDYIAIIQGLPERVQSKNKNDGLRFVLKIVSAYDEDVDPSEVIGKTIRYDIWATEDPVYFENRLKAFFTHCGIDCKKMTHSESISETPNREIVIHIKHEPSQDGSRIFPRIVNTAPVGN